ncbi:MAG: enoyl-CoA hydratase-related protein [Chloroflexi bacterium]|nr:enoyl-CoA hydratase-related protein [Chloroflexota bacterium]MDA1146728.1 enoyl-CoA hydratase-related protein [Chloroflexota bacterium]
MDYANLTFDLTDGVALVTLNRPERLNAISPGLVHELLHVVETTERDDAVKVLVFTGAGRAFCAGADVLASHEEREADKDLDERDGYRRMLQGPIGHWGVLYSALGHYPKPIIAAVNGIAAGAGLSLALASDIRIASTEAKFISIFIRRGLVPDTGTSWHLPQLIGRGRAIEMMLSGDDVDAETADRWGLVNRVVAPDQLIPEALALAKRLAGGPTIALELTKRLVNDITRDGLDAQLQNEAWAATRGQLAADAGEGIRSFAERRDPDWTGR